MDTILLFDLETGGTDPTKHLVMEVGVMLYSVQDERRADSASFTIWRDVNDAEAINGLPVSLLKRYGRTEAQAWDALGKWMARADVVMGHHCAFDRSFLPKPLQDLKPWVCTMDDIDWPRKPLGGSATALALAHGVAVTEAHRAYEDIRLLAMTLERCAELGHSSAKLLERGLIPRALYKAQVTFDTNQLAKDAGFRWMPERKAWTKKLIPQEVSSGLYEHLPFTIVQMEKAQSSLF